MAITIYHNPRCSKSRKSLQILEGADASPTIIRYLDEPPSGPRIEALAGLLGVPVRALVRDNEAEFREADDLPNLNDDSALAGWLSAHPIVLQRPIVVDDAAGRAVIGRPPENVNTLLT